LTSHDSTDGPGPAITVVRVQRAYEQVADQLRELIVTGQIALGERLPTEMALAQQFGVSRPTIREALRVLATQNLIRTSKGVNGGSFVTRPTLDHISTFLRSGINLLTASEDVSLEEFLEVREVLEAKAAQLAAVRRTDEHIRRLRDAIPETSTDLQPQELFDANTDFHSLVIAASGNVLLAIAAQPVFSVLQTNLAKSRFDPKFRRAINDDHRLITDAIESGDAVAAEREMRRHLSFIVPASQSAWQHARRTN
jgi:GntR family transcriptional repressor for pyruvate dehydrogenase complex